MPVSTRTRPAGVSISRQFSAWRRRFSGSSSAAAQRSQRRRGTGPNKAPASDRKVPAWTRATVTPPPRSRRQSTVSFAATSARLVRLGCCLEVAVEGGGRRLRLALVAGAERGRAVRPLDRARHLEERDLADLHPEVERDRKVRDVR